jgi:hypothetical protein
LLLEISLEQKRNLFAAPYKTGMFVFLVTCEKRLK